ncbi:hypothetical protein Slala03_54430 [Streptomyces lavendulae subsp. lavendulae]|uniref:hypothetical protein n=1 Tax=Streptomyces lavendulae TaxID=1914 RepID=UPI0024A6039F|nr:hypothetical protein [Streptomyces lavendulae]GLV85754.1 hypothetical protein Slala03_54430 [Streptomyces lavendulae subsp. lavendulae]
MYQTIADNSRLGQQSLQPWQLAATELDSCFPLAYFHRRHLAGRGEEPRRCPLRITCAGDRPVFDVQVEALRTYLGVHA